MDILNSFLNSSELITSLIVFIVTLAGGLLSLFTARRSRRQLKSDVESAKPQETLEDHLDELSKSVRYSARLVEQVSAELEARAATAKKLKEEAEAAEALAAINRQQAEAIRRLLDAELDGTAKRIRRDAIVIGIGSFIAGGGLSFLITLLVHPLH